MKVPVLVVVYILSCWTIYLGRLGSRGVFGNLALSRYGPYRWPWRISSVAFMDLGLLVIANSIMRTRLPPNKKKDNSTSIVKEILADVAYVLYMVGSFLVGLSSSAVLQSILTASLWDRFSGVFLFPVSDLTGFDSTYLHWHLCSLLSSALVITASYRSQCHEILSGLFQSKLASNLLN